MIKEVNNIILDLEYELQLLLGASKIVRLLEEKKDIGNPINYVKDSAYVHARNLYSFFHKNNGQSLLSGHRFNMDDYTNNWMVPLNNYVMHLGANRIDNNNVVEGVDLNKKVPWFAEDILRLWQEWIDNSNDPGIKSLLSDVLTKAQQASQRDYDSMTERIIEKS